MDQYIDQVLVPKVRSPIESSSGLYGSVNLARSIEPGQNKFPDLELSWTWVKRGGSYIAYVQHCVYTRQGGIISQEQLSGVSKSNRLLVERGK
ncbi:hypothetical protein PoB_003205000 [Plakobranchus ocellatus]|uniref:Uncharacterized protein n=1 Tax=Plakobranchus ocellatus TaxID=259542 RepID=A0AAV4ABL0_9GAST|nr:hypothetical protein PoB_003205000 [Plakobranchus ocellatus]